MTQRLSRKESESCAAGRPPIKAEEEEGPISIFGVLLAEEPLVAFLGSQKNTPREVNQLLSHLHVLAVHIEHLSSSLLVKHDTYDDWSLGNGHVRRAKQPLSLSLPPSPPPPNVFWARKFRHGVVEEKRKPPTGEGDLRELLIYGLAE